MKQTILLSICMIVWANSVAQSTAVPTLDESDKNNSPYIDQLIDETIGEDSFEDYYVNKQDQLIPWYNEVEIAGEWRRDSQTDETFFNSGIGFGAFKSTGNFGDLSLSFTALDEFEGQDNFDIGSNQRGISRYVFTQRNFPITDQISADTVIGTHRPNTSERNISRRVSRNLISRRFRNLTSDVLGASTQFSYKNSLARFSFGKFGENLGTVLPGFDEDEGRYWRAGFTQVWAQYLLSSDYWQTDDFEESDQNRSGYRFTTDKLIDTHWKASATLAASDTENALLIGLEQDKALFRQDFGGYYYEPDFYWLDRQIGDDNAGIYHRFNNGHYPIRFGGSSEFQRIGIDEQENARDTFLLNSNFNYRINRGTQLSGFYSFRDIQDKDNNETNSSSQQHRWRGTVNLTHTPETLSTIGLGYRIRDSEQQNEDSTEYSAIYSISHTFSQSSNADLSLEYTQERFDDDSTDEYSINLGWSKQVATNQSFTASVGYNGSNSDTTDNQGIYANLDYLWFLSDNLSLGARLTFNDTVTEFDLDDDPTALITDTEIDESEESEFNNFTALLSLNYNFGSDRRGQIIGIPQGKSGSGTIKGRVFVDRNLDGRYQPGEEVLSGIELFLDSLFPTTTNAHGEYEFRNVAVGEHTIYVDEGNLPLPLTLDGEEFHQAEVKIRATTQLQIAVTSLDF